jgi:bifunctional non-homologous end joining protein LigD
MRIVRSRNDSDLTPTYPAIKAAALKLRAEIALLDGEIVALDPKGQPSFQALQHRSSHRSYAIVFYAFDLRQLVLDGIPFDKAKELIREELFPPDLDPWAGDEKYGPPR